MMVSSCDNAPMHDSALHEHLPDPVTGICLNCIAEQERNARMQKRFWQIDRRYGAYYIIDSWSGIIAAYASRGEAHTMLGIITERWQATLAERSAA
jgi:hypothetical protein